MAKKGAPWSLALKNLAALLPLATQLREKETYSSISGIYKTSLCKSSTVHYGWQMRRDHICGRELGLYVGSKQNPNCDLPKTPNGAKGF